MERDWSFPFLLSPKFPHGCEIWELSNWNPPLNVKNNEAISNNRIMEFPILIEKESIAVSIREFCTLRIV